MKLHNLLKIQSRGERRMLPATKLFGLDITKSSLNYQSLNAGWVRDINVGEWLDSFFVAYILTYMIR